MNSVREQLYTERPRHIGGARVQWSTQSSVAQDRGGGGCCATLLRSVPSSKGQSQDNISQSLTLPAARRERARGAHGGLAQLQ